MTTGALRSPSKNGCGRGIFALQSWEPMRRPGEAPAKQPQTQPKEQPTQPKEQPTQPQAQPKEQAQAQTVQTPSNDGVPVPPERESEDQVIKLISKHTFNANPNCPGGFKEMSLKVGEIVEFIAQNTSNPYWWNARRETGETGYIPASYVKLLSDIPTSLPWLQKKQEAAPVQQAPAFKPYVSSYSNQPSGVAAAVPQQYYCDVCDREFNGPKPYSAHMVSKAHKEEVEVKQSLRS